MRPEQLQIEYWDGSMHPNDEAIELLRVEAARGKNRLQSAPADAGDE